MENLQVPENVAASLSQRFVNIHDSLKKRIPA